MKRGKFEFFDWLSVAMLVLLSSLYAWMVYGCTAKVEPTIDVQAESQIGAINKRMDDIVAKVETQAKADGQKNQAGWLNFSGNSGTAWTLAAGWVATNIIALICPSPLKRKKT